MIQVTYNNTTVTPMPSSGGLFGDATVPNSPAQDACLVRSAQALRSQGINVSVPQLTEEEIENAITAQLADKANWEETVEVTEDEVTARKDSIRGYSDEDVATYIKDNTVYEKDDEGNDTEIIESTVSENDAVKALSKKEMDNATFQYVPVTVPSNATIEATILAEKENAIAESKVKALVASGHLVTDLSISEYTDWKAQFTVTDVVV